MEVHRFVTDSHNLTSSQNQSTVSSTLVLSCSFSVSRSLISVSLSTASFLFVYLWAICLRPSPPLFSSLPLFHFIPPLLSRQVITTSPAFRCLAEIHSSHRLERCSFHPSVHTCIHLTQEGSYHPHQHRLRGRKEKQHKYGRESGLRTHTFRQLNVKVTISINKLSKRKKKMRAQGKLQSVYFG